MREWRGHAARLAVEVAAGGRWRAAFEEVPRHVFVPEFFGDDGERVDAADRPETVYADTSLVTQVRAAPGTGLTWPTSSSTRPSLMARMLELLEVEDGHRVLEIGTGTGYNAALLCHRLGDACVTSVDIDPELVEAARARLAGLGHRPHLTAGDGARGVAERAPYDRIIATCAVPAVPPAWIRQLRTGGLLVADVRGELASSLVVARKDTAHSVTGRFLDRPGHFMWLRPEAGSPLRHGGAFGGVLDFTDPATDTTGMPLAAFDDPDFCVILQLAVPGLGPVGHTLRDGRAGIFLTSEEDMSWIEIDAEGAVEFGGPRPLWPDVAAGWSRWTGLGRPVRSRLGVTAHDDGHVDLWVDRPG